jgi:hypothetical protein
VHLDEGVGTPRGRAAGNSRVKGARAIRGLALDLDWIGCLVDGFLLRLTGCPGRQKAQC